VGGDAVNGDDTGVLTVSLELPRMVLSHARRHWWRRTPPLPLPSRTHLEWRMTAAYGSPDGRPTAKDFKEYAAWRRRQRRASR
jgi:hypothetical protein